MDICDITAEIKTSHHSYISFSLFLKITRERERERERIWHENRVVSLNSSMWKNCDQWYSSMLAYHLQRLNSKHEPD